MKPGTLSKHVETLINANVPVPEQGAEKYIGLGGTLAGGVAGYTLAHSLADQLLGDSTAGTVGKWILQGVGANVGRLGGGWLASTLAKPLFASKHREYAAQLGIKEKDAAEIENLSTRLLEKYPAEFVNQVVWDRIRTLRGRT